jgi:hypothetical protein
MTRDSCNTTQKKHFGIIKSVFYLKKIIQHIRVYSYKKLTGKIRRYIRVNSCFKLVSKSYTQAKPFYYSQSYQNKLYYIYQRSL